MTSPLRSLPATITSAAAGPLDRVADLASSVAGKLGPGTVKDVLSGTWLGHPLHPVLTDVTVGAWTCAVMLDMVGGEDDAGAATTLVGVGVLSAVPTAISGWSDWSDTTGQERREGIAHGLGNAAAIALFGVSWLARRRGRRAFGVTLGMLGAGVASATAYLGGHLVYGRGVGVDVTAFDRLPTRWTVAMPAGELAEATPALVEVRGVPVMLLRRGDEIHALHDRCTHRGGPLHRGAVDDTTVTCPWHGSCFRLEDGAVVRGPATAPQPSFGARLHEGNIEVRRSPVT